MREHLKNPQCQSHCHIVTLSGLASLDLFRSCMAPYCPVWSLIVLIVPHSPVQYGQYNPIWTIWSNMDNIVQYGQYLPMWTIVSKIDNLVQFGPIWTIWYNLATMVPYGHYNSLWVKWLEIDSNTFFFLIFGQQFFGLHFCCGKM